MSRNKIIVSHIFLRNEDTTLTLADGFNIFLRNYGKLTIYTLRWELNASAKHLHRFNTEIGGTVNSPETYAPPHEDGRCMFLRKFIPL
jgi:hypothetical protein